MVSMSSPSSSPIPSSSSEPQFERKPLKEPLPTYPVKAVLVQPLSRLRFQPADSEVEWSTLEAMKVTRLVFTAWDLCPDGEEGEDQRAQEETVDIDMPFCIQVQQGKSDTMRRDLAEKFLIICVNIDIRFVELKSELCRK